MRVKMVVATGFWGADHIEFVDVSDMDLEGTTLEEWCQQYLDNMIANKIDAYYEVLKDEKNAEQ